MESQPSRFPLHTDRPTDSRQSGQLSFGFALPPFVSRVSSRGCARNRVPHGNACRESAPGCGRRSRLPLAGVLQETADLTLLALVHFQFAHVDRLRDLCLLSSAWQSFVAFEPKRTFPVWNPRP